MGDYELEGLIGRGSTGLVYRARPRAGGATLAVKRIRWVGEDKVVERLQQEAAAIAGLDHPHILEVVELVADSEGLIVAMPLADGGSLADVLGRVGPLPPTNGTALVAKVADALASAHALDLVHGDVKPTNILMDGAGEPLLSDFGLSRWIAGASPWRGAIVGTAEYLDPAVARGASPSAASDVYSLGIVCYQVLTGRLPYRGVTPVATLRAADRGRAEPLAEAAPAVSVGVAGVVERAMSRRPQERPTSAGELADALRAETGQDGRRRPCAPGLVVSIGNRPADHASGATGSATGPRPLRRQRPSRERLPEPPVPTRRSGPPVVTVGVAAVLVVLALTRWAFGHTGAASRGGGPCRPTTSTAPQQGTGATGGVTLLADVTGEGCRVPVTWSSGVITVSMAAGRAPVRYALGQPGDELVLGDWDCRRGARPALYRPGTGQVFYYTSWAKPDRDVAPGVEDTTTITDGVPRVRRDGARGCDRVEVARPKVPSR